MNNENQIKPNEDGSEMNDDGIETADGWGASEETQTSPETQEQPIEEGETDEASESRSDHEAEAPETDGGEGNEPAEDDEGGEGEEDKPKKRPGKPRHSRIAELIAKNNELAAENARLKTPDLPAEQSADSDPADQGPNSSDLEKYPLGSLDENYINDRIEWVADQKVKASENANRQRETDRQGRKPPKRKFPVFAIPRIGWLKLAPSCTRITIP